MDPAVYNPVRAVRPALVQRTSARRRPHPIREHDRGPCKQQRIVHRRNVMMASIQLFAPDSLCSRNIPIVGGDVD